jgi:hypothetical protein
MSKPFNELHKRLSPEAQERAGMLLEYHPELRTLLTERDVLRELVVHMWIHDGYPRNGYSDMTTEQKVLYEKTIEDGVS